MKDKIILRLKALFSGVNLSKDRLNAIADKLASKITDENQIDDRLNELNDIHSFADIAKQDDQIRQQAAELKKLKEPKTDPPADPADPSPAPGPGPASAADSETLKLLKELRGEIETLKAGKTAETRLATVTNQFKDSKIPESYYQIAVQDRTFKTDEEATKFATAVIDAYKKHEQAVANTGLRNQPAPVVGSGGDPGKDVSQDMQEYIKAKQAAAGKPAA